MGLGRSAKAQPEGPDQRSAELRWIWGERRAQWAYDEVGRCREWMRGCGEGGNTAWPYLRDPRRLDRDQQSPHPLFLRGDLDPFGHSPRELAQKFAELDFRTFSKIRVRVPYPMRRDRDGGEVVQVAVLLVESAGRPPSGAPASPQTRRDACSSGQRPRVRQGAGGRVVGVAPADRARRVRGHAGR